MAEKQEVTREKEQLKAEKEQQMTEKDQLRQELQTANTRADERLQQLRQQVGIVITIPASHQLSVIMMISVGKEQKLQNFAVSARFNIKCI